jgi:hypothetical protein
MRPLRMKRVVNEAFILMALLFGLEFFEAECL